MPRQLYGGKKKPGGSAKKEEALPEEVQETSHEQSTAEEPIRIEQQPEVPVETAHERPVEVTDVVLPSRPVSLAELPLDVIIPSRAQAREQETLTPESLQGLVASMKEYGILSRVRVRQVQGNDDLFELVFGERRWRAARLAGYTHYPVEIAQYTDDELEEVGLIENIQRQDLTALEEAKKYQRLLALQDEDDQPKYSIRKLATRIGKDKGYIEMRLAVLRSPEDVQQLVREQPEVPLRTAFEVSKVEDPEKREEIITDIREGNITKVEEVKTRVREVTGRVKNVPAPFQSSTAIAPVAVPQQQEVPAAEVIVAQQETLPTTEQEEAQPAVSARSSVEVLNISLSSTQALVLFEQQLREDSGAITDILHRLTIDLEVMTPAQREVLIHYIDRWGTSLMDLKSHARSTQSS